MTGDEAALQRALAQACLGAADGEDIAADLGGWLTRQGVPAEDISAILAAPARLLVYRSLVRNGLSSVVLRMLPRTRGRMNAAHPGAFDADLSTFVDQVGPRTHYLRDVPAEFLSWAEPRWRSDTRIPPYLIDLAKHELAHFVVAASASATQGLPTTVALDRPLAFLESTRLLHHAWAVHELPVDEEATAEPTRRDVHLLAYRDEAHAVRWLELTPLASAVLERLVAGEPLGEAVSVACVTAGVAPASVLTDVARLLADLGERGVLLGAREGGSTR